MEREGERLLESLPRGILVVACTPGGVSMTSEMFASWLGAQRDAARDVAFLIGGAFGLSRGALAASGKQLSLAPWTLPHELARLVLMEQLYRAGTILRGEPYHK
jgi:23S rRNA (pseudouridine1915-N3)-methyltransferase